MTTAFDYRAPGYLAAETVKPACSFCGAPADHAEQLSNAKNAAYGFEKNWASMAHLLIGEFSGGRESKALRSEALALLGQANLLDEEYQLARDLTTAQGWAGDGLQAAESRVTAEREALDAHTARQDRLGRIAIEMDELGSRLEAATIRRAESTSLDDRIAAESELAGIERVIRSLETERAGLNVPADPMALKSRLDDAEMDKVVWAHRTADPEAALSALVAEQRASWGSRLQSAIATRALPVSRLAMERY